MSVVDGSLRLRRLDVSRIRFDQALNAHWIFYTPASSREHLAVSRTCADPSPSRLIGSLPPPRPSRAICAKFRVQLLRHLRGTSGKISLPHRLVLSISMSQSPIIDSGICLSYHNGNRPINYLLPFQLFHIQKYGSNHSHEVCSRTVKLPWYGRSYFYGCRPSNKSHPCNSRHLPGQRQNSRNS